LLIVGQCPYARPADHILQVCPTYYATLNRKHWPEETTATDILYNALEDLQRTAAFSEDTGLNI
jgi:hypothetical protein